MPTIKIKGMSCQHCVAAVTKALTNIDGVGDVRVDLGKGEATYTEKRPVGLETIRKAIVAAGFQAE